MRESAYLPVFFGDIPEQGDLIELTGDEGAHAVRVRRLRVGERIRIADQDGGYADCEISATSQRSLTARVLARGRLPQPRPRLVVAQALPKGDRGGLAVELMTEAGVDEIIPWQARNCVSRWADAAKAEKGRQKWQTTAREAAKQSRRTRVPVIAEALGTDALIARARQATTLVLHESTSAAVTSMQVADAEEILLVVGPEGGITSDEIALLQDAGATAVRLGPEVLRTSTAGSLALAWAAIHTGRWSAPAPGIGE